MVTINATFQSYERRYGLVHPWAKFTRTAEVNTPVLVHIGITDAPGSINMYHLVTGAETSTSKYILRHFALLIINALGFFFHPG